MPEIIGRSEAVQIAAEFLRAEPLDHEDYEWVVSEPVEWKLSWYFDFKFQHVGNLPREEWDQFGGAPGYTVDKSTGNVEIISWNTLSQYKDGVYAPEFQDLWVLPGITMKQLASIRSALGLSIGLSNLKQLMDNAPSAMLENVSKAGTLEKLKSMDLDLSCIEFRPT